ncbi:MAG: hypothetical protein DMD96_20360 [Candidatus Rokuibacteriota bacterium]|nr:MAG: hypothetical protein DMD96_20360 [Candidatus Rokubacteria bacterium]
MRRAPSRARRRSTSAGSNISSGAPTAASTSTTSTPRPTSSPTHPRCWASIRFSRSRTTSCGWRQAQEELDELEARCGRNFDEILRAIDSLQLTDAHRVATPVNWRQGEDVIIVPAVTDEEARRKYPKGWRVLKPYLRLTPQPR